MLPMEERVREIFREEQQSRADQAAYMATPDAVRQACAVLGMTNAVLVIDALQAKIDQQARETAIWRACFEDVEFLPWMAVFRKGWIVVRQKTNQDGSKEKIEGVVVDRPKIMIVRPNWDKPDKLGVAVKVRLKNGSSDVYDTIAFPYRVESPDSKSKQSEWLTDEEYDKRYPSEPVFEPFDELANDE